MLIDCGRVRARVHAHVHRPMWGTHKCVSRAPSAHAVPRAWHRLQTPEFPWPAPLPPDLGTSSTPSRGRLPTGRVARSRRCERLGCSARVAGRGSVSASVVPAQRSPDLMSVTTGVSVQGTALLMLAKSWWPSSPTLTTEPSGTLLTAWPGKCHLTCHMRSHPSWFLSEAQVTATRTRHLPPDDSLAESPLPHRDRDDQGTRVGNRLVRCDI